MWSRSEAVGRLQINSSSGRSAICGLGSSPKPRGDAAAAAAARPYERHRRPLITRRTANQTADGREDDLCLRPGCIEPSDRGDAGEGRRTPKTSNQILMHESSANEDDGRAGCNFNGVDEI
ncbi:hypothetical protein EYF80_067489 [Liparis tanakae]|uniref:Uncharacterized protein n=1 Tax=Liparis tanakae TaxID=230148 RepID=A0A4Z2E0Z8_9TELE|nr:hypothetical protein EYF80_067489 [Liparis tanakae]